MKRIIFVALLVTQASVAVPLSKKLYLRADGGMGFPIETAGFKFRNNSMYGAGVGFKFNEILRADLNVQARSIEGAKNVARFTKAQSNGAFLNLYLNLTDYEEMTPYVNVGIGYVQNKSKSNNNIKGSVNTFAIGATNSSVAWNVGVGTTLRILQNISLDFGYKFINLGTIKFKGSGATLNGSPLPVSGGPFQLKNVKTHELVAGIVINF